MLISVKALCIFPELFALSSHNRVKPAIVGPLNCFNARYCWMVQAAAYTTNAATAAPASIANESIVRQDFSAALWYKLLGRLCTLQDRCMEGQRVCENERNRPNQTLGTGPTRSRICTRQFAQVSQVSQATKKEGKGRGRRRRRRRRGKQVLASDVALLAEV